MQENAINLEYLFDQLVLSNSENIEFRANASCKLDSLVAKIQILLDRDERISFIHTFGRSEMNKEEFTEYVKKLAESKSKFSPGIKRFFHFILSKEQQPELQRHQ